MKRKTTELEKGLIAKGFKLAYKTYTGNKSQTVKEYAYNGVVSTKECGYVSCMVFLNAKRDMITAVKLSLGNNNLISKYDIEEWLTAIKYCEHYVKGSSNDLSDDEVVESIEVLENV